MCAPPTEVTKQAPPNSSPSARCGRVAYSDPSTHYVAPRTFPITACPPSCTCTCSTRTNCEPPFLKRRRTLSAHGQSARRWVTRHDHLQQRRLPACKRLHVLMTGLANYVMHGARAPCRDSSQQFPRECAALGGLRKGGFLAHRQGAKMRQKSVPVKEPAAQREE